MSICMPHELATVKKDLEKELRTLSELEADLNRHWHAFHAELNRSSERWYRREVITGTAIEIGAALVGGLGSLAKLRGFRRNVADQMQKVARARRALEKEVAVLGSGTRQTGGRISGHLGWATRGRKRIARMGVRETEAFGKETFRAVREPSQIDRSTSNLPFLPGMANEWERMVDMTFQSFENLARDRNLSALLDFASVVLETADLTQWVAKAGTRAVDAQQAQLDRTGELYAEQHARAMNALGRRHRAVAAALANVEVLEAACDVS